MKTETCLTLLGAIAVLSACHSGPKPGDGECKNCKWENFLERPLQVKRIECLYDQKPEHCHLTTEKFEPKRNVTVTFDAKTGAYNWQLATPGKPEERMDCSNLAPDKDNWRVIAGTCIIPNPDQGPAVHFFRAELKPREEDPKKVSVVASFSHTPYGIGQRPVHDGNIHLDAE
jgi:hypothetical protein